MGRILTGLVLIVGVVFLVQGFFKDVKRNQKPPTQYIIKDDTRIPEGASEIVTVNKNDFVWNDPTFVIKERFRYRHHGSLGPDDRISIPFDKFKTDEGDVFTKENMIHFEYDIRTATMARSR